MVVFGKSMTAEEKIVELIGKNGGYVTRLDTDKEGIPSSQLSAFVRKSHLIRLAPGFYAGKDWIRDDYFILQYQYPKLVYSFYSSAFLLGLGDFNPTLLEVTGPKNYRPFPLPRAGIVLHTDTREDTYSLGIEWVETAFGNKVKTYNREKTVCDFIRFRKRLDAESFAKCLQGYSASPKRDMVQLLQYAKTMKVESQVRNLMEVLLNED